MRKLNPLNWIGWFLGYGICPICKNSLFWRKLASDFYDSFWECDKAAMCIKCHERIKSQMPTLKTFFPHLHLNL